MLKKLLLLLQLSIFTFLKTNAQVDFDKKIDPFSNSVILNHYSVGELQSIQTNDSVKFNTIVYYYTQSFSVQKVDCPTCDDVDISKIDISNYEYMRKKSERYVRHAEKYGFIITLLSVDELTYKLPIHIQ